ncbi:PREDICTED: thymidylate kinase [Tinamus guttatus]|uniref:thymidylate kinase n=1 Tax=Tinamus guttatus TaxID=94827 RepID=UPI00052ECFE7|nr:PREDICTED: thymidylate kinase [Tinamus guttatus]
MSWKFRCSSHGRFSMPAGSAGPQRSTELGRLLGAYLGREKSLEDHAVHLLFSANRWEHVPLMKEKLHQGITLVVDRYAFSGVAFTSAKQLSPEEAAVRGNFGNERYENSSFQKEVLRSFHHLMKDKTLNWKTVDASKSIDNLHKEIKSVAEKIIQDVQNKPLGELWK